MRVRIMRRTNIEYRARLVFSGECRVSMSHRCTPRHVCAVRVAGIDTRRKFMSEVLQIANETPDPGDQTFVPCYSILFLLLSFLHFLSYFKAIIPV